MDQKRKKLTPETKKLKLSTPETTSQPSNLHFICNKEVVIQLERLSDSVVAEMTAGGAALPPEQAKKKLKLSTTKTKLHPSNPHFICDKEVVIQLERLSDSFVAEMTADGSALPPEQTKKNLELSTPKTKLHPSNPHFICDKDVVIQLERLSDSFVAEMTADGSALPPEQVNESSNDALDINSLPDEMIVKIFGYLTQNKLGQIARVCSRWNALTKSGVLWRKVEVVIIFRSNRSENTMVKSFVNGLPSCVTFIRLYFSKFAPWDFEELCLRLQEKCPHLEELILTCSELSNSLSTVIDLCAKYLQNVKNLSFQFSHFRRDRPTIECFGTSKIEMLELNFCTFDHSDKPPFTKMPYLKHLNVCEKNVLDSWIGDDASFVNQLHVLHLTCSRINSRTFSTIQNNGLNLRELYFCDIHLRGRDLTFTNSAFPHLETICISQTNVTCESVVYLIQSHPSLQNVYVDRDVAESFEAHPFVVAKRCKSGIVKAIDEIHELEHNVDYSHT